MSMANLLNATGVEGDPNFSAGVIGATRGSRGAWPKPGPRAGIFELGVNERPEKQRLPGLGAGFMVGKVGQIAPRNTSGSQDWGEGVKSADQVDREKNFKWGAT